MRRGTADLGEFNYVGLASFLLPPSLGDYFDLSHPALQPWSFSADCDRGNRGPTRILSFATERGQNRFS